MAQKIKVMLVDDSALVRQTLKGILESSELFEVTAAVGDPYQAVSKIAEEKPDVIILDIEMPRLDGLSFLQRMMSQHPIPTIICSSLAEKGTDAWLKAISYGAVDVITKPKLGTRQFLEESSIQIQDAVEAASHVKSDRLKQPLDRLHASPKLNADAVIPVAKTRNLTETTEKIMVIGASTGGTEALRELLEALPEDAPGILIVQHMPENFTRSFAERLDSLCRITVREAADGDTILRGQALIAPGNRHCLLKRSGAVYKAEIKDGPLVARHRPSVDVLFRSAAINAGKNALGIILTGMGDDGARGMKELHDAGAWTIAQDEESCVVFGMPKEAIKLGGIDVILPLNQIAGAAYKKALGK